MGVPRPELCNITNIMQNEAWVCVSQAWSRHSPSACTSEEPSYSTGETRAYRDYPGKG